MSVLPDRFLNKKHPHSAANATSYVSRQVPLNVQKAPASTTFNFRIGTQPNTFVDPSASFLRWKIRNTSTNCNFTLGSAGAPGVFETINLLNSGSQLSHYQNYGVFRSMKNAMNCSVDWMKGPGSLMQGTAPELDSDIGRKGAKIAFQQERVFVDPICNHTSLFNCGKMISLDTIDNLDLRYTIGDYTYGGAWDSVDDSNLDNLDDSALEFSDFELVLACVQLDSGTASQLRAAHPDGNICYECRGIGRVSATIPKGVSGHNVNLGLGYSSLMALNAVQLPLKKGTIDANNNQTLSIVRKKDHHNSTFVRNYLSKHIFLLDGSPIENLRHIKGDPAEIAAFQQIATGNFHKFDGPIISNATGGSFSALDNDAEAGSLLSGKKGYVLSQELCIYKQKAGHWADSEMSVMCEGRGTLASSTQINLEFNGSSGEEVQLEVFPEYRQLIVLDNNTKTYRVSQ